MSTSRFPWRLVPLVTTSLVTATLLASWVFAQGAPGQAPKPAAPGKGVASMLTRPERTNYQETSSYDDVLSFMKAMAAASPQIHLTTYGYTYEGRPMPLAVIGAPDATPEAVLKTKKTRVYIQGDIHAGEVEGKEAALWLLRSVAKGERAEWLKSVVLLVNPIYNADGNEKVNLRNRGRQNGPVGGMGQRANGQNLDLNRDCTKLESSEARSLAALMTRYDPHVAIDLHTTDGSPHGFYLTYQTSVSPNTSPGLVDLARNQLFPFVTKAVKAKHGWDYFYYGNLSRQGERAWYNDAELYKPRYTQTYFGIRNRLGILVETYSYATFEDRIKADYWFLEETLNFAVKNAAVIQKATAAADAESIVGKEQSVRGKLVKQADPVQIVLADSVDERNPYVPDRPMLRRVNGSEKVETMPHYALVEPTETSVAPRAYVIPSPPSPPLAASARQAEGAAAAPAGPPAGAAQRGGQAGPPPGMGGGFGRGGAPVRPWASILDRLEGHGVKFFRTSQEMTVKGERFRLDSNTTETQEYQGHKMRTVTGKWEASDLAIPAGSIVVPMDQPLARLAFLLFDPRSDDGFMTWNLLDESLGRTPAPEFYPVLRTMDVMQ
jgi:hypothetical protein